MIVPRSLEDEVFKRRNNDFPSLGTVVYADAPALVLQTKVDEFIERVQWWKRESDRSKWERIGQPLFMSVVDWGIIINPYSPAKLRQKAIQRQIERFIEYS